MRRPKKRGRRGKIEGPPFKVRRVSDPWPSCSKCDFTMAFQPMPLSRRPAPFDHPDWVFELKYDGFRSLAIIQNDRCQLISRNGHAFSSFPELQKHLAAPVGKTVIDGEIVCLDKRFKPRLRDLLFHRGDPCFFAFDLLMRDGKTCGRKN